MVVRSTLTLAFSLKALCKLGHRKAEPKERETVSLSVGNKDWSLGLLRQWEFEGHGTRNEKAV